MDHFEMSIAPPIQLNKKYFQIANIFERVFLERLLQPL